MEAAPGLWRTDRQRHDLNVPGRKVVQTRLDITSYVSEVDRGGRSAVWEKHNCLPNRSERPSGRSAEPDDANRGSRREET
jgi:hypothetical protein